MTCATCGERVRCVSLADVAARIRASVHRAGGPGDVHRQALKLWNVEAGKLSRGMAGGTGVASGYDDGR